MAEQAAQISTTCPGHTLIILQVTQGQGKLFNILTAVKTWGILIFCDKHVSCLTDKTFFYPLVLMNEGCSDP